MSDALPMLRVTCVLLGVWGLLNAAQWFADMRSWRDGSALGWDLQRLHRGRLAQSKVIAVLYAPAGLSALACLQLLASAALIASSGMPWRIGWLAGYLLATLMLALRAGTDGADKMVMVVTTGALLQSIGLWCNAPRLVLAGVLWTGGQLTIAYFASGATKLLLGPWRRGDALSAALSSYMWGHRWAAAVVGHRGIALCLAWLVMIMETTFPLALLAPQGGLEISLAGFVLFHAAIAVIMGLNHYPWAFAAAYPAVLLLGQWLKVTLGLAPFTQ